MSFDTKYIVICQCAGTKPHRWCGPKEGPSAGTKEWAEAWAKRLDASGGSQPHRVELESWAEQ